MLHHKKNKKAAHTKNVIYKRIAVCEEKNQSKNYDFHLDFLSFHLFNKK